MFLIMHRLTGGQNARAAIKSIKMSFQLLKNSLRKLESSYIYIIATCIEGMEQIWRAGHRRAKYTRGQKNAPRGYFAPSVEGA